ncbi:hypothetical protein [Alishewanella sp. HL-SH05]|uniref:hypothetical protein n=1 Tax=Alishewanella sp. HL-SH05 TaxID=3461145 RepID=UPI0040424F35
MDLAMNKVLVLPLFSNDDKTAARFTIVSYFPGINEVVLCQQDRRCPKKAFVHIIGQPLKVRHCGVIQLIPWDVLSCERQDFRNADNVRAYESLSLKKNQSYNSLQKAEKRWLKIDEKINKRLDVVTKFEECEQRKLDYFNGDITTEDMRELARGWGVKLDFLCDTLSIYYAFGQCREALIPVYNNCGQGITLPKDAEDAANRFPHGRGRHRLYDNSLKRPSNQQDFDNVMSFFKNDLPQLKYFSLKNLSKEFNAQYATELVYEDKQSRCFYDFVPERFLTLSQFKNLLKKVCGSKSKFEMIRLGSKEFRNKFKIHKSSVLKHVVGPGSMYEIDATVLDVHLVSNYCVAEVLPTGRPILYIVVDVSTTMIAGFHLSLESPNAESVTLALYNAMSDKESFCKQWGYDYQPGDWPCFHVCHSLVIDRGSEYLDAAMARLIRARIGLASIQVTEAYLGRAKGTVEGLFSKLNKQSIHALPGALIKGKAKALKDPSNHASLTISDLYYILIEEIIAHNNTTVLEKKRTQEHLAHHIDPLPRDLWNWGMKELMYGGNTVSPKVLMSALLPQQTARVTKQGVILNKTKITYQTKDANFEDLRQEIVIDRSRSDYEINVMYLPSCNQHVWYNMGSTDQSFITFDLADSNINLKNLHMAESHAILEDVTVFKSKMRHVNAVEDAVRTKRVKVRIDLNKKLLSKLRRSEGKSAAKGTEANKVPDLFAQAQNNANTVFTALEQQQHACIKNVKLGA